MNEFSRRFAISVRLCTALMLPGCLVVATQTFADGETVSNPDALKTSAHTQPESAKTSLAMALTPAAPSLDSSNQPGPDSELSLSDSEAAAEASAAQLLSHTENYRDAIDALESQYGPYSNELPEQLLGLGIHLQRNGRYQEAHDVFKRAIHVDRINQGLYSLSQVPMIEKIIESSVALGDWESASDIHQYLYWLHKRNFASNDPRMLPVITKLSKWHLNAYSLEAGSGLFQHLINAHNLYSLAVSIIDRYYGDNDMRLIESLKGITLSNYYLATYQAQNQERPTGFQTDFNGSNRSEDERLRLEQYILRSYSNGKEAITRIEEVYNNNPEAPVGAAIQARIELADWNMMFDRPYTALDLYQDAYREMTSTPGMEEQRDQLFGQPVALPDMNLLGDDLAENEDGSEFVLVKFDVTSSGRARNIQFVETSPDNSVRLRSRVKSSLRTTKFRPRFADGEAVATKDVTQRFVFSN